MNNQVTRIFFDTPTKGTATVKVFNLNAIEPEPQVLEVLKGRAPMARGFTKLAITSTAEYINGTAHYVTVEFFTAPMNEPTSNQR